MSEKFYIEKIEKYVKKYEGVLKNNNSVIMHHCPNVDGQEVMVKAIKQFRQFIPKIPYIGGNKNPLTTTLIGSVQLLSLIVTFEDMGISKEVIGKVIYGIVENIAESKNKMLMKIFAKRFYSKSRLKKITEAGIESQKRQYPGDWVFEINENDQGYFQTQYECGIHKLYTQLGYESYVPYLCLTDYATCAVAGLRLERSKTIADGDDVCNFKFVKGGVPIKVQA